jgi:hypothetical protein
MLPEVPKRKTSDRLFQFLAMAGIATVAVLFVWSIGSRLAGRTQSVSEENNAYLKVSACVTSTKTPTTRTHVDIDRCYEVVERDHGLKLKRYDQ